MQLGNKNPTALRIDGSLGFHPNPFHYIFPQKLKASEKCSIKYIVMVKFLRHSYYDHEMTR